jgi:uroporphyrinogen decarboxylase
MTDLELFRATCAHERHRRFLCYASFTPDLLARVRGHYALKPEEDLGARLGIWKVRHVGPKAPDLFKPDFARYFADVDKPAGSFINGLGVLEVPANFYHFTGYVSPLRNARSFKDIEEFPYPIDNGFDEAGLKDRVREIHAAGMIAALGIGHMYESAWQIRGYEEFLIDMVERPEWCEYILDRLALRNRRLAEIAARAGVDYIRTGDDVANQNAMMFSLPAWRRFMKPRWATAYAAARAINPRLQVWYHSDGNIADIIPELIEIGVTILNPVQPECLDLAALKKAYGKKLVFDGTIGTQSTMPFGSPEEVRRTVRERKRALGRDGALILSPTHVLEPEVPLANIAAFFEEAGKGR